MNYAIVDIETTGSNKTTEHRITEIAVYLFDGEKVIQEFTSLVNPENYIPPFITRLTGIDNEMVQDAPLFEDIIDEVDAITKDAVFVAHNVNFDYSIIKGAYKLLGRDFERKRMCTVSLSRKIIPGHRSYSLGKICTDLNIPINGRHRAGGDAYATVQLFAHLLKTNRELIESGEAQYKRSYGNIPPLIDKEVYKALPEKTGVYYFHDRKGRVIYVGKAVNIKKRVASHFNDKSGKELLMLGKIADIKYHITNDELIALLLESNEIKEHQPMFNKVQRKFLEKSGFSYYYNQQGIIQFFVVKNAKKHQPILRFYSEKEVRSFFAFISEKHGLCPRFCEHKWVENACFNLEGRTCLETCGGEEAIETYNKRVLEAIDLYTPLQGNQLIYGSVLETGEKPLILIEDGIYKGFAFVPEDFEFTNIEELLPNIRPQRNHRDIHRLLKSWLRKNPELVVETFENKVKEMQFSLF